MTEIVEVRIGTVGEALETRTFVAGTSIASALEDAGYDAEDATVMVNKRELEDLGGELKDGDTVVVVPKIEGGSL